MSETTTSAPSTPETAPVRESLNDLASKKHAAFAAKINGSIFGKERVMLQEQYDVAESAYVAALRAEVSEQLETTEFDSIDQKIDYFELLVNERIVSDREAQQEELIAQGGKRAEFLTWYANLPKGKKIAATVGLAAGGAAAGALMSFAGAGVATVALSLGAYRLARGYNMRASKLYESPQELPVYKADKDTFNDESIDRAMAFLRKDSQSSIERAEKIKKRAIIGAVGAVALGSTIAAAMDDTPVGEAISEKTGQWAEKFTAIFMPSAHAAELTAPLTSPVSFSEHTDTQVADNLSGRNADMYGRTAELSATATTVEKPTIAGSFTVEKGHGYTHELMETVKETYGVELSKQEAWELHKELVRTAGSDYIDLLDQSGNDAYSLGDSRYEVGIADDGKAEWSDKAIKFIDQKYGDHDVDLDSSDATVDTTDNTETPLRTRDHNLVTGTGGQDFDHSTAEVAPRDTSRNLVQGTGGTDMPIEAADQAGENDSDELAGLTDAHDEYANGYETIYESMKNDVYEMRGMLLAGDIESINNDYSFQTTLDYVQRDIGNMTYPGTDVPIIEKTGSDFTSQWIVNDFPEGVTKMPDSVINVFDKYINSLKALAP